MTKKWYVPSNAILGNVHLSDFHIYYYPFQKLNHCFLSAFFCVIQMFEPQFKFLPGIFKYSTVTQNLPENNFIKLSVAFSVQHLIFA